MNKLIFKRSIFYILSFTWGGIMSLIGLIGIIILAPFGKLKTYHGRLYCVIGDNWGGASYGCFFFCGKSSQEDEHLKAHECGHMLQNCIWGPLFPFVIAIPSALRYLYREHLRRKNPHKFRMLPEYDAIWFEGQASKWGKKYVVTDIF